MNTVHSSVQGVDPSLLYDGPDPQNVHQFRAPNFAPVIGEDERKPRNRPDYVAMVTGALDVLNARLLSLIAMLFAGGMFIWATYDPQPWRLATVATFAGMCLLPSLILNHKA